MIAGDITCPYEEFCADTWENGISKMLPEILAFIRARVGHDFS